MKKCFLFAALGLSMMAQAVELDYYKTLVDEQADASKGTTQLYNLEYAADGSLYLLSMYQTVSSAEVGLNFNGNTYQGATAAKWGSKVGDFNYTNMRNSFLAKLDAEGNLLWAKADTTGDYDLAYTALAVTNDGGVIYADKFRTRKAVYMGFINVYDKNGQLLGSNSMSFTNKDSVEVDGKKVFRKEAFNWAGVTMDKDSFIYLTGVQTDTLLPVWNDSLAPRKAWTEKSGGINTSKGNTFVLKYKLQPGSWPDVAYTKGVINSDELDYDRPLALHLEDGKLYIVGTYGKGDEKGIYAARYNTNLEREFIVYHPINATLQFQQTKFADGKIYICGGAQKGSITVGEKTITAAGTMNNGFVYIIDQETGQALDFDIQGKEKELHITAAALPTEEGLVAYHYGPMGTNIAINYNNKLEVVSVDTLAIGGGSSTLTVVGRSADGKQTAVGLRAGRNKDFNVLGETFNFTSVTNWYSVVAVLKAKDPATAVENVETENGKAVKFIQNGKIYIRHNGRTYNVLGF